MSSFNGFFIQVSITFKSKISVSNFKINIYARRTKQITQQILNIILKHRQIDKLVSLILK